MFDIRKQARAVPCVVVLALSSVSGAALASEMDQPIQVNVDGLQQNVARQVREHADESLRSLMQYLWFTRKTHRLWIEDVTKSRPETVATNEEPTARRERVAVRTTGIR